MYNAFWRHALFVRGQSFSVKTYHRSRNRCQVIEEGAGNDFRGPSVLACSRLRDSGGKSFSEKQCEKRAGAGERQCLARVLFSLWSFYSLRSRRLEVVGTRKNGRARRRHARGEVAPARKAPENRFPPPLQLPGSGCVICDKF